MKLTEQIEDALEVLGEIFGVGQRSLDDLVKFTPDALERARNAYTGNNGFSCKRIIIAAETAGRYISERASETVNREKEDPLLNLYLNDMWVGYAIEEYHIRRCGEKHGGNKDQVMQDMKNAVARYRKNGMRVYNDAGSEAARVGTFLAQTQKLGEKWVVIKKLAMAPPIMALSEIFRDAEKKVRKYEAENAEETQKTHIRSSNSRI